MTSLKFLTALLILTFIWSCKQSTKNNTTTNNIDSALVADTIIYPVRIKNIDSDDQWAEIRLKNVNRKKIVNDIFEKVYSGDMTAYNYLSNEPISIEAIKTLEKTDDFNRENIIELEFREKWWFNADKSVFKKEIISILLAYVVYDEFNEFSRMKAAFYVKMNTNNK
ncbi:MAG: hypothetical protein JW717_00390 [Marinilabiliaceae bacterium]|nr:hypothetical protein [Marinilabiliaceae bacterium]